MGHEHREDEHDETQDEDAEVHKNDHHFSYYAFDGKVSSINNLCVIFFPSKKGKLLCFNEYK